MVDVSVLIPARNAALTIERAIRSALDQPYVNIEVIVCPNNCTDDTEAQIQAISDARVITVHGNANSVASALNLCADAATGDYFIELDSDDWLGEACLKRMVDALDCTPSHIGYAHGAVQYHGDETYLYTPRQYTRRDLWHGNYVLYPFLYKRMAWDAGCRYQDHLFLNGKWLSIQDWDMLLQLSEYMRWDGVSLPDVLVLHYNYNRNGETQRLWTENRTAIIKAFQLRWPIADASRIGS